MSENEELQVTSTDKVKEKIRGKVVPMPGWDDEDINVRIRRPALVGLVREGKIPNELLGVAEKAIEGGTDAMKKESDEGFKQMVDLLYIMAENAIVEPDYKLLEGELTDEQLFFIYAYVMQGVRGLENFRKQLEASLKTNNDMRNVGNSSK